MNEAIRLGGDGVAEVTIGGGAPLAVVAGPCVIESPEGAARVCAGLVDICRGLDLPLVFKSSFDKANRTSRAAFRGPGLDAGLAVLSDLRHRYGVPVTADVHLPSQAARAAEVVDLLQVPAFLCRQTDLLEACGATGRPVNVKKGQFLAPWDMRWVVEKARHAGAPGVMVTERGTVFGYNDLVVDMRSLAVLGRLGVPVCFDATHSVQQPGARGTSSGGRREFVPHLARAAVAVGVDAVFMEVHDEPDRALSDGPNMVPLDRVERLLRALIDIDRAARSHSREL